MVPFSVLALCCTTIWILSSVACLLTVVLTEVTLCISLECYLFQCSRNPISKRKTLFTNWQTRVLCCCLTLLNTTASKNKWKCSSPVHWAVNKFWKILPFKHINWFWGVLQQMTRRCIYAIRRSKPLQVSLKTAINRQSLDMSNYSALQSRSAGWKTVFRIAGDVWEMKAIGSRLVTWKQYK